MMKKGNFIKNLTDYQMRTTKTNRGIRVSNRNGCTGIVEEIDISELGYVSVKVFFKDSNKHVIYTNSTGLHSILKKCNLKLIA